jgi:hypothetical protein
LRRHAKASTAASIEGAGNRQSFGRSTALALLALVIACLAFAGTAAAKTTNQYLSQVNRTVLAPQGSRAATGLAVSSAGDVYVANEEAHLVEHYNASGAYVGQIDGSTTPSGGFIPSGVAVGADGSLYVVDQVAHVVDEFDAAGAYVGQIDGSTTPAGSFFPIGVAVTADGHVYAGDGNSNVVFEFEASGAYVGQFDGSATPQGFFCPDTLTSGAGNHVFVADICNGVVDEFDASGMFVDQIDGSARPQGPYSPAIHLGLAEGASGDLYVGDAVNGVVDEYGPGAALVGQVDGGATPQGPFTQGFAGGVVFPLSVAAGAGSLYVAESAPGVPHLVDKFSEARVVLPDVANEPASALDQTVATLNGTVNPDGEPLTGCHFDVVPAAQFEVDRYESVTAAEQAPCVPTAALIPADSDGHAVSAELTGLQPNTTYHYRLDAANAHGTTHAPDETFITLAPPSVSGEGVANLIATNSLTEADLIATVNPNGTDTFYRFEYGLDTSYGSAIPIPDADAGSERTDQNVGVHVSGLQPETTYHFRVVAHSTVGTTEGLDHTFRTAGGPFPLPDGRAWEQVTPVNKRGINTQHITGVADDGNAISYSTQAGLTGAETLGTFAAYVARRTDEGWVTSPLSLPARISPNATAGPTAVSADLTKALLEGHPTAPGSPPVSTAPAQAGLRMYVETLSADPDARPTYAVAAPDLATAGIGYLGGADDLSTFVVASRSPLTSDPITGGEALYEIAETDRGVNAPVRRVDVDNAGVPISGGAAVNFTDGFNAVSRDGSRIFFDAAGAEHLYARTDATTTTAISDPSPSECTPSCVHPAPQAAIFAGASEGGTRAYFTTTQELVAADTDTTADLYEYDFSAPASHHLTLISEGDGSDATPGSGAEVFGMVRLSDDGTRAAFVAHGVLTTTPNASGDEALAGADNLYVVDHPSAAAPVTRFVGVIPGGDSALWEPRDAERPVEMSSTDGRYLVFGTHAQLTADDTDGAEDVYRFDDQSGDLLRVSHGHDGYGEDGNGAADATIEPSNYQALGNGAIGAAIQAGRLRAITDDGSIISFHTLGSLQLVDQNGKPNAYEWNEGEVSLVGDPLDPTNRVEFSTGGVGVLSRSGGDLFTFTGSSLVPQDTDGTVKDIYDARVGGGFPYTEPAACDVLGDTCQGPSATPPAAGAFATAGGKGELILRLGKVTPAARRKFAETGRLALKVSSPEAGKLSAKATAKIGGKTTTVASAGGRLSSSGTSTLRLRLSKAARKQLAAAGKLTVKVVVRGPGATAPLTITFTLTATRPARQAKGGRS